MNLLLTLAAFTAVPAAPVPAAPAGQEIQITKSFELGALAESFNLVSAEYKYDQNRGSGTLLLKLEAKKEVEASVLRQLAAGFFDDDNTLQLATSIRPTLAFPLQKGERLTFSVPTGAEDKKWNRIVVRKSDVSPSSFSSSRTTPADRGFGVGPAGRGGFGVVPPDAVPPANPPQDR